MGEGLTPLIERGWRGGRARFKLEWFAPTGSFKDRGATMMISTLRQQGIDHVLEDSSGNGGAAIAAYAAAGGMRAKILVPAATQSGKSVQMRAYGAETELIAGTRQDTADAAERQAKDIFYASHNCRPSSSKAQKPLPTSFGRTSGSGRTTSSFRQARAATSWAATLVSANSCAEARSAACRGPLPSNRRTARLCTLLS